MKTSILVDEDKDFRGITAKMIKDLVIKVYPSIIEGYIHDFDSKLSIKMSNGDHIEYDYYSDPAGVKLTKVKLLVNGIKLNVPEDFTPSEIATQYKLHFAANLK